MGSSLTSSGFCPGRYITFREKAHCSLSLKSVPGKENPGVGGKGTNALEKSSSFDTIEGSISRKEHVGGVLAPSIFFQQSACRFCTNLWDYRSEATLRP